MVDTGVRRHASGQQPDTLGQGTGRAGLGVFCKCLCRKYFTGSKGGRESHVTE